MIIFLLALVGLMFGSFVNALVWRINQQSKKQKARKLSKKDLSITKGRSMCTHCHHNLAPKDLVPVLSWVSLKGRCRYCHKKIQDTPLTELLTAVLFVASYIWWPMEFDGAGVVNFVVWLVIIVGFVALLLYDFKWLILPNRIVYPLIVIGILLVLFNIAIAGNPEAILKDVAISVAVSAGLFWGLFELSKGKWIGGGDVKLGLVIGLIIAVPIEAFLVIFLASLIGTVFAVPSLVTKRLKSTSHIPFGPYLIIATVIVKLFGASLVEWYKSKFLLY